MNSATRVSSPGGLLVSIWMSALSSSLVSRSTSATTAGSMPAMSTDDPLCSTDANAVVAIISVRATRRLPCARRRPAPAFEPASRCGIVSFLRGEVAEWLKATAC